MKKVFKCDYCGETFATESEAIDHENNCGRNPKNKIINKTIFRLSMIFLEFQEILASAVHKYGVQDFDYLISEIDRASENNCPYMVFENKARIRNCLIEAESIDCKRKGLNRTALQDVEKKYPEILEAATKTLQRPAWNER